MASLEVDQKFLGKLARAVEPENPLLASILFKILGLSINLSQHTVNAKKQHKVEHTSRPNQSLELYFHIIWLSREGLTLLEQYVIPMVGNYVELKVLAHKLRASFYHIFVQFHNQPPVTTWGISTPEVQSIASMAQQPRRDKGKGLAKDSGFGPAYASFQPTYASEGGPVGAPPGFGPEPPAAFLFPAVDYVPIADRCFKEAVALAQQLLWGSHSLRLSVKTEYSAFLYECVHDAEYSRQVAKETIADVYDATEGIDNDMFTDACALVAVLGKMMKRGLGSNNTLRSKGQGSSSGTQGGTPKPEAVQSDNGAPPPGMI